jgi:hypothetical protein
VSAEDWRQIGEVVGYITVGLFVAYKAHKAERNAAAANVNSAAAKVNSADAKMNAQEARDFAAPVGNGFARYVKDSLACLQNSAAEQKQATERIELRQQQDSTMLYDHIKAHANADVLKGAHRDSPSDPNAP